MQTSGNPVTRYVRDHAASRGNAVVWAMSMIVFVWMLLFTPLVWLSLLQSKQANSRLERLESLMLQPSPAPAPQLEGLPDAP